MDKKTEAKRGRRSFADLAWWHKALVIMGCIAILSLVVGLLISSDRLSGDIYSNESIPSPDGAEFVDNISHLTDTSPERGGSVELLNNGDQFLARLLEDIHGAKKNITFTDFIWHDGEFSDKLFSALIERQKSGVRVLLLLDDSGVGSAPKGKAKELESFGGEVKYFRRPRFTRITRLHQRDHRRAIVIDGKIGYMGGIAIEDAWLGNADQADHWHDTMARFTGPTAIHIQNGFAELWMATTGEILGSDFYNAEDKSGPMTTVSFISSPAPDTQKLPLVFWYSFASAKKSIYITNPYFLPPDPILNILAEKAKQGVDVRIILPSELTDAKSVRLASQSNYSALLDAGVKIYEYEKARVHAKQFVVDGSWAVIGSANMDSRSFLLNEENVIGVQDKQFASAMEAMFREDMANSKEITKEDWSKRGAALKVFQYLARIFQKQL